MGDVGKQRWGMYLTYKVRTKQLLEVLGINRGLLRGLSLGCKACGQGCVKQRLNSSEFSSQDRVILISCLNGIKISYDKLCHLPTPASMLVRASSRIQMEFYGSQPTTGETSTSPSSTLILDRMIMSGLPSSRPWVRQIMLSICLCLERVSGVGCFSLQLLDAGRGIQQLRFHVRRYYWTPNCWTFVELYCQKVRTQEQRCPRSGDATARATAVLLYHNHWPRSWWPSLTAAMVLANYHSHRFWLRRPHCNYHSDNCHCICRRVLQPTSW